MLFGLDVSGDKRATVESTPGRDQRQARSDQERLDFDGLHETVTQGEVSAPTLRPIPGVHGLVVKRHGQYRSVAAGFEPVALAVHRRAAGPRIAESRPPRAPTPIEEPLCRREGIEGEPTPGDQRRRRAPKKAQQIGVGLAVLDGVKRRHGEREAGAERQGTQIGPHQERAPSAGEAEPTYAGRGALQHGRRPVGTQDDVPVAQQRKHEPPGAAADVQNGSFTLICERPVELDIGTPPPVFPVVELGVVERAPH